MKNPSDIFAHELGVFAVLLLACLVVCAHRPVTGVEKRQERGMDVLCPMSEFIRKIWYTIAMNFQCRYVPESERTEEDRRLAESAARASKRAIEEAFAAGLSITIARGNRIVRVAPDGTETFVMEIPCRQPRDSV